MVVNMGSRWLCHPPVGLNLYVASGIYEDGYQRIDGSRLYRG